jgi:hypothetical protein
MRTNLGQTTKVVAAEVFAIQAILAVNPNDPKWCDVNWSSFKREKRSWDRERYFVNSKKGQKFYRHPDRPKHYYGEKFWTDVPAFMTLKAARACLKAITEGGWADGRELRITKQSFIETLEVVE